MLTPACQRSHCICVPGNDGWGDGPFPFLNQGLRVVTALHPIMDPALATIPRRLRGGPADGRSAGIPGRLKIANRGVLAGALVRTCLAQHSGSVQFHFEQAREGRGDHSMGAPA